MHPAPGSHPVSLERILEARRRIAPLIHRTPVLACQTLDRLAGRPVLLKCENLQRVGAFKFRGAANAILRLSEATARLGVVTHSSGNHAQAVALAARIRGIPAHVVMPWNAPAPKKAAVEGYGAVVIACEPDLAAREAAAARVVQQTGGTLVPPYDHPDVIAGQGTIALELLEDCPDLAAVVAPIGGGGMISGLAIALRALAPSVGIVAADDAARSKAMGSIQPLAPTTTIADGLRTTLGELTFPILRDLVDEVVTVSEAEIVAALRLVLEDCPDLAAVVAPIGGGGMISGLAIALHALAPSVRIVAAEPLAADDAARSKAMGSIQPLAPTTTIADGLRTTLGELTFPILRDLVDEVVTVSEAEIVAALRLVLERAKLVIEPSAAVPVAAVLAGRSRTLAGLDGPVVVVLSGGNLDLDAAPWALPAEPPVVAVPPGRPPGSRSDLPGRGGPA